MKFTNDYGLPDGIVEAIVNSEYDTGGADYTPSQLTTPPQIRRLMQLYSTEIVVDVSDEIWKLFGTSVHYILDKAQKPRVNHNSFIINTLKSHIPNFKQNPDDRFLTPEMQEALRSGRVVEFISELLHTPEPEKNHRITERRFFIDVAGYKVGAKPDWYDTILQKVEDYKVTSVWKVLKQDYEDYIQQLNVYKLVLQSNNLPVQSLQINAILKDWKKFEQARDEGYPRHPVAKIEIPQWDSLDTLSFIITKIKEHESVKYLNFPDDIYKERPCTPREKWSEPDSFAVMKKGGKRASKVFDTEMLARSYVEAQNDSDYYVETRKGTDKRCEEYCLAKPFCAQYKAEHNRIIEADTTKPLMDLIPDKPVEQIQEEILKESKEATVNEADDLLSSFHKEKPSEDTLGELDLDKFLKED